MSSSTEHGTARRKSSSFTGAFPQWYARFEQACGQAVAVLLSEHTVAHSSSDQTDPQFADDENAIDASRRTRESALREQHGPYPLQKIVALDDPLGVCSSNGRNGRGVHMCDSD
jgi:hypothetical protein